MGEWKEYKLGDLAKVKGGKRLPLGKNLTEQPTNHPYIRTRDINNNKIAISDLLYVPADVFNLISRYIVEKDDVIISIVGTIGLCAIVPSELHLASLTENCAKIVDMNKSKLNSEFLFYFLICDIGQEEIGKRNVGSTQPKLPLYNINDIPIPIPPLDEQRTIASILSSLDDKIDLLHRQNKTLEALAETLFRQWFVEEVDESWEVGTIDDEFDFTMGQSPEGNALNENKVGMIFYQGRTDFGFRFPSPRVYTNTITRLAKKFDTLVSVRAPVGDMNMAIEECCLGRGVAGFRYKVDNDFYSYTYYKMRSLIEQIKQFEDSGTVFGSIGKEDFKKLENIIPSNEIVYEFQKIVKPIDDKIYSNTIQIRTITQLRDTLLPKLMSGEVRVK